MSEPDQARQGRLETEAIVIGYAMSRLDGSYLRARGLNSWSRANAEAAEALRVKPSSISHLRDEFDPIHPNARRGWHARQMRTDRLRVLEELQDVSDDALVSLVAHILARDEAAIADAIDSMVVVHGVAANVAERLLTGRRAEEHFEANCGPLVGLPREQLIDYRNAACGFDYGVTDDPARAFEIKGMQALRGEIQLTDREWAEARRRGPDYCLIVVGNLAGDPIARVFADPASVLVPTSSFQRSVSAVWRSRVSVLG